MYTQGFGNRPVALQALITCQMPIALRIFQVLSPRPKACNQRMMGSSGPDSTARNNKDLPPDYSCLNQDKVNLLNRENQYLVSESFKIILDNSYKVFADLK